MNAKFDIKISPTVMELKTLERNFLVSYYSKCGAYFVGFIVGIVFAIYAVYNLGTDTMGYGILLGLLSLFGLIFFFCTHSLKDNPARLLSVKEAEFVWKFIKDKPECADYIKMVASQERDLCYFDFGLVREWTRMQYGLGFKKLDSSVQARLQNL